MTNIQCGEVFLSVLPLNSKTMQLQTMNCEKFLEVLVKLAEAAFRGIEISTIGKVKALLLHMFKTVSSREKVLCEALKLRSGHTAAFDMHGSDLFRGSFPTLWREDGFIDYLVSNSI